MATADHIAQIVDILEEQEGFDFTKPVTTEHDRREWLRQHQRMVERIDGILPPPNQDDTAYRSWIQWRKENGQ